MRRGGARASGNDIGSNVRVMRHLWPRRLGGDFPRMWRPSLSCLALLCVAATWWSGCRRPAADGPVLPVTVSVKAGPGVKGEPVGRGVEGKPWVTHVLATDLDGDGRTDALVCDARLNQVSWLHRDNAGLWVETPLGEDIPAPVHTDVVDWDGDGDQDIWVASMGVIFPNNDRIGALVFLENQRGGPFVKRVLEEHIARVTDIRAADLNGDGQLDLAIAQFGYDQGEVRWLEQRSDGAFVSHPLIERSGAIHIEVADFNGDRFPDLAVNLAQQWEEVLLLENDGRGQFRQSTLFASTNEDFGSSGLFQADLNGDKRPDLILTNGDGFDYAEPGARPWHGVQWLENKGGGRFLTHRIGDLPGAYGASVADWNGDGRLDVFAVSGFNQWESPEAVSLVVFLQAEDGRFRRQTLARSPTHLLTTAVGDFLGDGRPALLTGGFHAYPPYDRMSRLMLWRPEGTP